MSLTKDDLENIRTIVKEEFFDGFSSVWEHNIEPTLSNMPTNKDLEEKFKEKLQGLATNKNLQDARDYIVKVSGDKASESIKRDHTLDEKGNEIASTLGAHDVFTREDVSAIKHISPFPVSPGE